MKTQMILIAAVAGFAAAQDVAVSHADLLKVRAKVAEAAPVFQTTWTELLRNAGVRYSAPRLQGYESAIRTGCGVMDEENAYYCGADNAIYFHVGFLAKTMKKAGRALGTDGDYAAIAILAHEFGHSIMDQFPIPVMHNFQGENAADCLAGVATKRAESLGRLNRGDEAEAEWALRDGGDDFSISILHGHAHGPAPLRLTSFRAGYSEGPQGCGAFLGAFLAPSKR